MEYFLLIVRINNADTTILFYKIALYMIPTNRKKTGPSRSWDSPV